jgi:hypothetical protein
MCTSKHSPCSQKVRVMVSGVHRESSPTGPTLDQDSGKLNQATKYLPFLSEKGHSKNGIVWLDEK